MADWVPCLSATATQFHFFFCFSLFLSVYSSIQCGSAGKGGGRWCVQINWKHTQDEMCDDVDESIGQFWHSVSGNGETDRNDWQKTEPDLGHPLNWKNQTTVKGKREFKRKKKHSSLLNRVISSQSRYGSFVTRTHLKWVKQRRCSINADRWHRFWLAWRRWLNWEAGRDVPFHSDRRHQRVGENGRLCRRWIFAKSGTLVQRYNSDVRRLWRQPVQR